MASSVKHSSDSNEQYTPVEVIEASRKVLERFDLDPASCELANQRVKAARFFAKGDPVFEEPWHGRVFLNPPGGKELVLAGTGLRSNPAIFWLKLMHAWHVEGTVEAAIVLGFTMEVLQSTQGVEEYPMLRFPFCIPRRRVSFDVPRLEKLRILKERALQRDSAPLEREISRLEASEELLVRGDDPPHGNVLVFVPPKEEEHTGLDSEGRPWVAWQGPFTRRFQDVFSDLGYVRV